MTRVVVTGLGVVSPIGNSIDTFWHNLVAGVSGVGPITQFDATGLPVRIAAEVKDFDPSTAMDHHTARRSSRFVQFSVAASRQAIDDAGLNLADEDPYRVGVVINTGGGGMGDISAGTEQLLKRGPDKVSPLLIPSLIPNMGACQVSITFGIKGPVITSILACASGIHALVAARRMILDGDADVVLAGGAESCLMPLAFAGLSRMGALSKRNDDPAHASRPFDADRDGFVFGEGAGVLVLEREDHARARGVRPYAEVLGGSLTADAYHVTAPEPSGESAARAITDALRSADIGPGDVDYIVAHGTGTQLNDASETRAIKLAFGKQAYSVPISSPKSMVGHLLGAAGAISALTAVLAINHDTIPPTTNLDTPDPECDLDYVPNRCRELPVRTAIANGFGFGGQNSTVVLREA